jgi:hypothetical protein
MVTGREEVGRGDGLNSAAEAEREVTGRGEEGKEELTLDAVVVATAVVSVVVITGPEVEVKDLESTLVPLLFDPFGELGAIGRKKPDWAGRDEDGYGRAEWDDRGVRGRKGMAFDRVGVTVERALEEAEDEGRRGVVGWPGRKGTSLRSSG